MIFLIGNLLLILCYYGLSFYGSGVVSNTPDIIKLLDHSIIGTLLVLTIILRVAIKLDEIILKKRQSNGLIINITEEELTLFNQSECLETPLLQAASFQQIAPQYIQYSDEVNLTSYEQESLALLKKEFHNTCEIDHDLLKESQLITLEEHCLIADFPHLPLIQDREQWGLIARTDIPKNSLLPWVSDWGVIKTADFELLDDTETMNRRRLYRDQSWEVFQGGGRQQRSNPALLANFFWCQTPSMATSKSPFMLYPPHFLGIPNCAYVTCRSEQGVHSGLLAWRNIKAGEQILMYTGSGSALINLYVRLTFIQIIKMIYPAIFLLILFKIYYNV